MDSPTANEPYYDDGTDSTDSSEDPLSFEALRCRGDRCGSEHPYRWIPAYNADPEAIRALDAQDLKSHCPLDNGRHDITAADEDNDLGAISLPNELIYWVIKHLDIRSLTTFRRVSKCAMRRVDGTFEYQQIMKCAPQIIRGALTLEADSFTLNDAYLTLLDQDCTTCCGRASFIYLITCERVCSECLIQAPRWKPRVDVDVHWNKFGNPYPHPMLTPSAMGRPGIYGTAGGYRRIFVRSRAYPNQWILKNLSSRFWDARHCGYAHSSLGVQAYNNPGWYASAFFVSVSVPLLDHQGRDTGDDASSG